MACMKNNTSKTMFLWLIIFTSLHCLSVSFEFQVGGNNGWVVPPVNDSKTYNDWASENRFQAGDTIRFKYKKDSVMEVSEEDYKKCNSTHPIFFSNTGNSLFMLKRSGSFYFISGVSGHCQKGQRMIVKVMYEEESSPGDNNKSSAGSTVVAAGVSKLVFAHFVFFCVAYYLF
ncbi:hypothetical protein EZV62_020027 [Acer yangbiense]|uniref:Phytocyanin domain-containing protein n=1 Tax=Acer yangbiense TaxID=1000413 RepID=A0A5C7HCU2_9ROSI|nr:hypothetical protein EZV62_020027 [Acer yangbiense]